jgi:hypothetical protein
MKKRASRPPIPGREEYGPGTGDPVSWETAEHLLEESHDYWLSTTRSDARPHAVPIWAIWCGGSLFFATAPRTVTARNLAANPKAVAHPDGAREVVIVEGSATLRGSDLHPDVVEAYEAKYGWRLDPADPGMPFFELRPHVVLAWSAEDIRGTASRWQFS